MELDVLKDIAQNGGNEINMVRSIVPFIPSCPYCLKCQPISGNIINIVPIVQAPKAMIFLVPMVLWRGTNASVCVTPLMHPRAPSTIPVRASENLRVVVRKMGRRAMIDISRHAKRPNITKVSLTRSVRIDRRGRDCERGNLVLEGVAGSSSSSSSSVAVCSAISLGAFRNGHFCLVCLSVGCVYLVKVIVAYPTYYRYLPLLRTGFLRCSR